MVMCSFRVNLKNTCLFYTKIMKKKLRFCIKNKTNLFVIIIIIIITLISFWLL